MKQNRTINTNDGPRKICYDCKILTMDWVKADRAIGGGQEGATYAEVPVCNNRKECKRRQRQGEDKLDRKDLIAKVERLRKELKRAKKALGSR